MLPDFHIFRRQKSRNRSKVFCIVSSHLVWLITILTPIFSYCVPLKALTIYSWIKIQGCKLFSTKKNTLKLSCFIQIRLLKQAEKNIGREKEEESKKACGGCV